MQVLELKFTQAVVNKLILDQTKLKKKKLHKNHNEPIDDSTTGFTMIQ